uniref:Uncharacterized protein n=1 Tax=Desertifilum tharense IPPAS B-1220 TaxID=1781255 RepID=A0ACD5GQV9_9CYAN
MGKTFAIAIGINQYQHFQPLNYAQQDAQALWDLWTQRLGIPSNQCFLLTDSAQAINGQSTYPERETLQNWLDYLSGDGTMVRFAPATGRLPLVLLQRLRRFP